jgi:hypothetical protein
MNNDVCSVTDPKYLHDKGEFEKGEEERLTREYFEGALSSKETKPCVFCGAACIKPEGCNYATCLSSISNPLIQKMLDDKIIPEFLCPGGFNSKGEQCWLCEKPKYQPDPLNPKSGACNDPNHNSHS